MATSTEVPITPLEAEPELSCPGSLSIALIGPNDAHRKTVANALAGPEAHSVREFLDYPGQISDLPRMIGHNFDVVLIDVDTDESYALALIEYISAIDKVRVVAYSMRSSPALEASCLRAGAHDFLPLPSDDDQEPLLDESPFVEDGGQDGPDGLLAFEEQNVLDDTIDVYPAIAAAEEPPSAQPQNPARETEPDAYDFTEWDARFLRRARPAAAEVPVAKPQLVVTPEPPVKCEPLLAAAEVAQPIAEIAQPAAEIKTPVEEIEPPETQSAPSAVESNEPVVESTPHTAESAPVPAKSPAPAAVAAPAPVKIPAPAVVTAAPRVESNPPSIARTLIPIDWTDDEFIQIAEKQTPPPVAEKVELFRASQYKAEAGEDEDEGHWISLGNLKKWVLVPAGLALVAGLLFLIFGHPFRQVVQVVQAVQSAASQPEKPGIAPAAKPSPNRSWKTILEAGFGKSVEASPVQQVSSDQMVAQLSTPPVIPTAAKKPAPIDAPPDALSAAAIDSSVSVPGVVFGSASQLKVEPDVSAISAGVAEGLLIHRTAPLYPAFAREHNLSGTVVLSATITKTGALEGMRVLSGPSVFRNPAVDSVKTWRYKPYMLDNQPVDVQTTISVVFKAGEL